MFADFLSDNLSVQEVTQESIPFFRKKIKANILNKQLPYPYLAINCAQVPSSSSRSSRLKILA